MTLEEARRRRMMIESEHYAEANANGQTPRLFELNKMLTTAIFEEAHADRNVKPERPF